MLISILTVLSILTAVSSLTVVFIPTAVYILTVVSSLSVHTQSNSYFHVIFISAYPAVQVKLYAYVNMLGRNNLISNYVTICWKGKQSASLHLREGKNQYRNNANDSFGKGFHVLKDHVQNRLMTGRCPHTSLQLRPKFHSLFLQISFDFQKSATFKGLKSSPRMYTDVSFNPEISAFSRMESNTQTDRLTDRQSDYCNLLAHAR